MNLPQYLASRYGLQDRRRQDQDHSFLYTKRASSPRPESWLCAIILDYGATETTQTCGPAPRLLVA